MISELAVAAAIASTTPCWLDRDDPRKPEQTATIVRSVSHAADTIKEAALLLTVIKFESNGCIAVHSGEHKGPGRGLYQLEGQAKRHAGPFVGLDYDSTFNATTVALKILRSSHQCGSKPEDILTAYAGRKCQTVWPTLKSRRAVFYHYNAVIWREVANEKRKAA